MTRFQLDLAMTRNNIGWMTSVTGDPAEQRAAYGKALAIQQKLADANPGVSQFQLDLALSHSNIGWLLFAMGDTVGARAAWDKALAIRQKLADANPNVIKFQQDLAASYVSIGDALAESGETAAVRLAYGQALAIRRKLADAYPGVTDFQRDLADSTGRASIPLSMERDTAGTLAAQAGEELGDPAEAGRCQPWRDRFPAGSGELPRQHQPPAVRDRRHGRGASGLGQGAGRHTEAGRCQPQRDFIPAGTSQSTTTWAAAGLLSEMGETAGAQAAWGKALAITQKLADANPNATSIQRDLANSHASIGSSLSAMGELAGARAALGQALAIQQKLADANPAEQQYRREVVDSLNNLSDLLRKARRPTEARDGYDRALAIGEPLARDNPKNTSYQAALSFSLRGRGLARLELGDIAGGTADTRRALEIWDGLPTRMGEHWFETACCHRRPCRQAARGPRGLGRTGPRGLSGREANKAMALLNKAVRMSYRQFDKYDDETALDGLRSFGPISSSWKAARPGLLGSRVRRRGAVGSSFPVAPDRPTGLGAWRVVFRLSY